MSEKAQNVQDVFLNHLRKNKTPVTIFLVNGVKLQGIVTWFDNFSRAAAPRRPFAACLQARDFDHHAGARRCSCSTGTKPTQQADLIDDIEHDGQDKRKRQAFETVRPATVAAVLSPYASGDGKRDARGQARGGGRACPGDRPRRAAGRDQRRCAGSRPATLVGKGVVERLKAAVEEQGIGLVIVDDKLTPVQQRNLEKAWQAKVIDRTGLILEIFGARARTHEGRLQVELAALDYQRGRLVRSWTHLERQRGGFGFLGGPGEIADRDRPPPDRRAHRADQARPRGRAPHARRQSRRPPARRACRRSRWSATPTPASRRCSTACRAPA